VYFEATAGAFFLSPGRYNVTRVPLDPGDAGVFQSIDRFRRVVREAHRFPVVKEMAVAFTTGAGDTIGSEESWRRLFSGLRSAYRYVRDTRGVEELWSPEVHAMRLRRLGYTWGDCDDLAVLAASLARSLNLGALRFVTIANGRSGRAYNHIWSEVEVRPGVWRSFDFLSAPRDSYPRIKYWRI
jgi:hypothetical protein